MPLKWEKTSISAGKKICVFDKGQKLGCDGLSPNSKMCCLVRPKTVDSYECFILKLDAEQTFPEAFKVAS